MLDKIRVWFAVRKSKQLLKYLRGSPWLYDQVRKELESCYNKNNNPGKARNIRASGVVCY